MLQRNKNWNKEKEIKKMRAEVIKKKEQGEFKKERAN